MLESNKQLNPDDNVADMIYDIANGICGLQMLSDGSMLKSKKKKLAEYKPKTQISLIINDILSPVLKEIHTSREWDREREFISFESKIKLIDWEVNSDWCIVQIDNNKEQKINKKWFRELYLNKL